MKYSVYTVKEGDTAASIARKFDVLESTLVADNNITGEVFCGMKLAVKKRDGIYYTVKPFDTASSVARAFGITEARLAELNGLENNAVFLGQTLYIEKDKM
ncbi:MAG TPA: LysM peptidoglycan-binding domain-containing protein [Candidatus Ornithoclostridium excrementipullorum]|nr:LysM peptidoglycan-binding domain-containing protein [Candidatus Ornithoclostridium excrementipullorum]